MAEHFDGVFHGNSGSECYDFIYAVRQHAKDNGKPRDDGWIADEVFNSFRGKAFRWYAQLPKDVRGDWELPQQALLARWTTDDDITTSVSSLAILPTPAAASAAPPPDPSSSQTTPQDPWTGKVGRVRARANGTVGTRYISTDCSKYAYYSGAFFSTTDAAKALEVRLIATAPNFYRLELVEHESGLSILAAFNYSTDDWNMCGWGLLVAVDAPGLGFLKDRRTTYNGPDRWKSRQFWTDMWQIGNTGVLNLCCPGDTAAARFNLDIAGGFQDSLFFCRP